MHTIQLVEHHLHQVWIVDSGIADAMHAGPVSQLEHLGAFWRRTDCSTEGGGQLCWFQRSKFSNEFQLLAV